MKTAVLVSGVVLLGLVGAVGGYQLGVQTEPDDLVASSAGELPPEDIASPVDVKTPVPNKVPPFTGTGLRYRTHTFDVRQPPLPKVEVSIDMPRGWIVTSSPKTPGEVKFLDPLKERGVRVESGFAPELSPYEAREKLMGELSASQPPENDLQIVDTEDSVVTDNTGTPRDVSTLVYTFIPNQTLRYVIVRWIATGDDQQATVEMSVTGLPQDAAGLKEVLARATESVTVKN
ncbi:hypothetical protein Kfla_6657 [Kribbella flavida DSM 17836]|uniref:Lipoprotein LpqN n=1 Tax=Kribbella flavida (strain DSM 17836 / JCM 10339 / NBRC 14399) TaxID=479435 RepID=D2PZT3_KRIFD|nr:hypothetical protein [Kribbella flavida]ADB35649.1 hypothetical protein Kfla_6657 [Kribbella flavida DSM 17836]